MVSTDGQFEALLRELKVRNYHVRVEAVGSLAQLNHPQVVPVLIGLLKDRSSVVRHAAIEALGKLDDAKAVAPLLDLVDAAGRVRRNWSASGIDDSQPLLATWALLRMRNPEAFQPLLDALVRRDGRVRAVAAACLGHMKDAGAFDHLIGVLTQDEHPRVRAAAAKALGEFGDARALQPLYAAFAEDEEGVRGAAIVALAQLGADDIPMLFAAAMRDADKFVRAQAVTALGYLSPPPVGLLLQALHDPVWDVQSAAESVLKTLKEPIALELLLNALSDAEAGVRHAVTRSLASIRDPRATPALVKALEDEDWYVQGFAAEALDALGWAPETRKQRAYYLRAKRDWKQLAKLGAGAITPIVELMKSQPNVYTLHTMTARSKGHETLLKITDPQAVDHFLQLLENREDSSVWVTAVEALGRFHDPRTPPVLLRILETSSSDELRGAAALSSAKLGATQAIGYLTPLLTAKNDVLRWKAANALELLGWTPSTKEERVRLLMAARKWEDFAQEGKMAAEMLLEELRRGTELLYETAVDALARMTDPGVVDLLVDTVEKETGLLRRVAIDALGRIGSSRGIPPLLRLLEQPESSLRFYAFQALHAMGWQPSTPTELVHYSIVTGSHTGYCNLGDQVIRLGGKAVEPLIQALAQEPDDTIQVGIIDALAAIGDEKAVTPIIRQLQNPSPHTRRSAAGALGRLRNPAAVQPLIHALHDPVDRVAIQAAHALGELRTDAALNPLIQLLTHKNTYIRKAAVQALGAMDNPKARSHLIQASKDTDYEVRQAALHALNRMGPQPDG